MIRKICLLAFTDKGMELAGKIENKLSSERSVLIYDKKKEKAADFVSENFAEKEAFVFVGATGIAVRLIAPFINRKDKDPAVIVIDELGRFVIPVLSGHIGGGNQLALEIAEMIGAEPVITTATDINGCFSADVWATDLGCVIEDISRIRDISSAVLRDEKIGFRCVGFSVTGKKPSCFAEEREETLYGITVSTGREKDVFEKELRVIPRIVTLGVGCRKNTDSRVFEKFVLEILEKENISLKSIENVVSVDLKKNEKCILDFCRKYELPFQVYSAQKLMEIAGDFDHSDFVEKTTGADNICERSASLKSGGKLIIRKTAAGGVTVAAAAREWMCKF